MENAEMAADSSLDDCDTVDLPIDGVLDLHMFRPRDVGDLVPTYLEECRRQGIRHVRIIHGKGTGALRETVHAILRRTPCVASFGLAPENAGGWGATLVELAPHAAAAGRAALHGAWMPHRHPCMFPGLG